MRLRRHRLAVVLGTAAVAAMAWSPPAGATPVFARRYGTSCVTCHLAFPRLTPFGEAFLRNGYRFPDDDEDQVKEQPGPLALGADAYRRLFPDAVWPTTMPGIAPVGFVAHGWIGGDPFRGRAAASELSFDRLAAMVDLFVAAHLGERFTVYGKLGVGTGPSVEPQHQRLYVSVNDLVPSSTVRVGQFVPELFQANQSVRTCTSCHFSMHRPVGDNRWDYGPQVGIEASGTLWRRWRWVVGAVEGNGNQPNLAKDVYARVSAKAGGLSLDGRSGGDMSGGRKNWVDNSIEAGIFAYYGNADVATADMAGQPVVVGDRFVAAGGDAFVTWRDLGVYVLAIQELHTQPRLADKQVRVERYVGRARYVVYPWLVPEITVEYFNSELDEDMTYQVQGAVDVLVRANLKLWAEVIGRRDVSAPLEFHSARLLLDVGF